MAAASQAHARARARRWQGVVKGLPSYWTLDFAEQVERVAGAVFGQQQPGSPSQQ